MNVGDKFILNIDYVTYHDACQTIDDGDNLTEEEYEYVFGKLVEVTGVCIKLTVDELWCELKTVNSNMILYIPESYCKYDAIVDENEINRVNTIENDINQKLSDKENPLGDDKERRKKLLSDRRNDFHEKALLNAIIGAGNACAGKPKCDHYGIICNFINDATGIALYEFDDFYKIR